MVQTIFIRLPRLAFGQTDDHNVQVEWCASDGVGRPAVQRDPLQAVLESAANRDVVILVPTEDVILTDVDLPIRQRAKLRQAVPYALEDQLAEDIDKMHFAIGERQADGHVPVLSVAHERMRAWLAPFESAGIEPRAVLPDVLFLPGPIDTGHWSVLCEGVHVIVKTGPHEGFACDTEALPDYLSLSEASEELELRLFITGTAAARDLENLPVRRVETEPDLQYGLQAMQLAVTDTALNLLQGDYAQRDGKEDWWRPFRMTASLLVLWIFMLTLVHGVEYFQLQSELSDLQEKNQQAIDRLFPEIQTLVPGNERVQLERRLKELRGEGSQVGLFRSLSAVAQALQTVGKLDLEELQLREGILYLSMTAQDIATLEDLKRHFGKQTAWELDVQSANARSEGVKIRASLRSTS